MTLVDCLLLGWTIGVGKHVGLRGLETRVFAGIVSPRRTGEGFVKSLVPAFLVMMGGVIVLLAPAHVQAQEGQARFVECFIWTDDLAAASIHDCLLTPVGSDGSFKVEQLVGRANAIIRITSENHGVGYISDVVASTPIGRRSQPSIGRTGPVAVVRDGTCWVDPETAGSKFKVCTF